MSEIIYQHYLGRGPEAEALIAEANAKYAAFLNASDAFSAARGFEGLWQSSGWHGPRVSGPIFTERLGVKEAKAIGLKHDAYLNDNHGYAPHLGTKLGKELQAALDELNKSSIDRVKYVIEKCSIEHEVFSGGRIARTTAGFKDGVIVVKVPTSGDHLGNMPTPPPWLVPCKKSEALAALGQ